MSDRPRFAGFELTYLLVLVTTIELALNRLAVRELRPPGEIAPWWHQALDHVGLFSQYFAATLAMAIIGRHLWRLASRRDLYASVPRWGLVATGIALLLTAARAIVHDPDESGSFVFESVFTLMLVFLALAQATRPGDVAAKIGVVLLAIPLMIPYYGPLWLWLGQSDDGFDLPERVRLLGQWAMVAVALASPYCFAPRPFLSAAARLGPLVVAAFVAVMGVVILRQNYEVGMRLAHQGLGIDIGPGAPERFLAVYLLALSTITWTLTSCLGADTEARRDIGVGLCLIVLGGYGFAWPFQYLVGMAGLLTISEAAVRVAGEERAIRALSDALAAFRQGARDEQDLRVPPIAAAVWDRYVHAVMVQLHVHEDCRKGPILRVASKVEAQDDDAVTHIYTTLGDIATTLRIERQRGVITGIDVLCGPGKPQDATPQWTLYALPEGLLGIGAHPEPPAIDAPVAAIADAAFAERFRVRDVGGYTERLLDDGLRARAIALIDGWMSFRAGHGLHYHVRPGQGAPLDHPIPITDLAFRGTSVSPAPERLVRLVDLLVEVTRRGLAPDTAADAAPDTAPRPAS